MVKNKSTVVLNDYIVISHGIYMSLLSTSKNTMAHVKKMVLLGYCLLVYVKNWYMEKCYTQVFLMKAYYKYGS